MQSSIKKLILLLTIAAIQACTSTSSKVSDNMIQVEFKGSQNEEQIIEIINQEVQDYCKTGDQAKILSYSATESMRLQYFYEDVWAFIKGDRSYPYEHVYRVDSMTQEIVESRRLSYETFNMVDAQFSCS